MPFRIAVATPGAVRNGPSSAAMHSKKAATVLRSPNLAARAVSYFKFACRNEVGTWRVGCGEEIARRPLWVTTTQRRSSSPRERNPTARFRIALHHLAAA